MKLIVVLLNCKRVEDKVKLNLGIRNIMGEKRGVVINQRMIKVIIPEIKLKSVQLSNNLSRMTQFKAI